jgi:hypothetical protein
MSQLDHKRTWRGVDEGLRGLEFGFRMNDLGASINMIFNFGRYAGG